VANVQVYSKINIFRTTLLRDSRKKLNRECCKGDIIVDRREVLKIWDNYITELWDRTNRLENLEIELEEEVDENEKGPYILRSEKESGMKEMKGKKIKGCDDVPGDVLRLLGDGGHRIMTQVINRIYETGE
jgi:hypothetical protein